MRFDFKYSFAFVSFQTLFAIHCAGNILPSEVQCFIDRSHTLPNYVEAGYSPLGRSSVVDAVLADPFYLPVYAETVSQHLKQQALSNSIYKVSRACFIAGGIPLKKAELNANCQNIVPVAFSKAFGEKLGNKIHFLWQTFLQVSQDVDQILAPLSKDDKTWLRKNYDNFFFNNSPEYDFFTTDSDQPLRFFTLASRIHFADFCTSAGKLGLIVDEIFKTKHELLNIRLENDFLWEESGQQLFISSKELESFTQSADFFLCLRGNNSFTTSAGGTEGIRNASLHVSLEGNNVYVGEKFVQGSGFLGVGILANFGGNNLFLADAYSQGLGFFGVGIVVNYGGNNTFKLNFGGQSCALFGSSVVWNKEGDNDYLATEGFSQAASSTLGVAFLVDSQGGNSYLSGKTSKEGSPLNGVGQGASSGVRHLPWEGFASLYGGLAFLYASGDHNHYQTSWFGQGSAYFLGCGILVDEGNEGRFIADVDSQGQGLHLAAGLLLKKGSHNHFNGGWGSLGVGADRSVGMFISNGEKNHYEGTTQSIGTARKPKALGVFIDLKGDNSYQFAEESCANIQKPSTPLEWPTALFASFGKPSVYLSQSDGMERGNNKTWGIQEHSLGIDRNICSLDLEHLMQQFPQKPRVPFAFDPIAGNYLSNDFAPLYFPTNKTELTSLIQEIMQVEYQERRHIYESIDLYRYNHPKEWVDLSVLLKNPEIASEDQFNYAILWALQNKDESCLEIIIEALKNNTIHSEYARAMAIKYVGQIAKGKAIPALEVVLKVDSSFYNKAKAAFYIAHACTEDSLPIIEQALASPNIAIRYMAVFGLRDCYFPKVQAPKLQAIVLPLLCDKNLYVRRAAAMTAISLHVKEGISVLLETLQVSTLDTTDNYGDNIYSVLAKYTGVDFGLDRQAWIDWWNRVKDIYSFPQ